MTLELEMSLDNSAFFNEDTSEAARNMEVARILKQLAQTLLTAGEVSDGDSFPILDVNGNKVGRLRIEGD